MGAAICWQCLNIIGISFSTALAGNAFMRRFFLLPLSGMINCSMSGCQGDSNPDSNNPSLEYRSLPLSSRYHRPFFPRPPWGPHGERNVEAIHRTQITVSPNLRGSGSLTKKPVQPGPPSRKSIYENGNLSLFPPASHDNSAKIHGTKAINQESYKANAYNDKHFFVIWLSCGT